MRSSFFKLNLNINRNRGVSGFTLIELMVTIGIFIFMTAILLARYNSFGSGTILTNMAYDIALTIRQAQTYGLSVMSAGNNPSADFTKPYGVHFDTSKNTQFILYKVNNTSGNSYTVSTDDISKFNLKQGATISRLCVVNSGTSCSTSSTSIVDITFRRPDPKAIICANNLCNWKYSEIEISSADGSGKRTIVVTNMGLISVKE